MPMRARLRGRAQESLVVCRGWLVGRSIREEREWIGRRRKRHEGRHVKASKDAAHHAGKRVKTVSFGTVIWRTLEYVCQVSESFRTRASDGSKQEMCQPALHRSHNRIYILRVSYPYLTLSLWGIHFHILSIGRSILTGWGGRPQGYLPPVYLLKSLKAIQKDPKTG